MKFRTEDERWMQAAHDLAEGGRLWVSPNPMVGACVVRAGHLVGQGYHRRFGGGHAEVLALRAAGRKARGATLYVTLEPCSTWGKTPPCVSEILRSGVRRVVVGVRDPNVKNHGRGVRLLRGRGLSVKVGVLARELHRQNEAFFHFARTGRPFVTLKMAQTFDGKIAGASGRSRWISSTESRRWVHRLRAESDAVLVGTHTLLRDNPRLSVGGKLQSLLDPKPWRVVLDPRLEAAARARVFRGGQLTLRAVSKSRLRQTRGRPGGLGGPGRSFPRGSMILPVLDSGGRLDLADLMKKLGALGVARVLAEGGGETAWSLLQGGLVNKILWVVAPKILGGRDTKTSVEGEGWMDPSRALALRQVRVSQLGDDWVFEAYPRLAGGP